MNSTQAPLIDTPQPHQIEHRYDYLRVTIRVQLEPVPGEEDLYKIVDYRRKRDSDQKWSIPVKEEIGRVGTLREFTPAPQRTPSTDTPTPEDETHES